MDDPGISNNRAIKIYGIDTGPSLRGFNIFVFSPTYGYILGVGHFDTSVNQYDSAAMIYFISKHPDGSIVCIAVFDSANGLTQDAIN